MACLHSHHGPEGDAMAFAEPGVRPHYAPDRVVRIRHLSLQLSLEPADRTFRGEARIALSRLPTFAGAFDLDLDEVEVASVTDGAGAALRWELGDGRLTIRCEQVPDEVVVRFGGSRPQRGLYFTGPTEAEPDRAAMAWTQCQDEDAHFVFPCHDHPGIKHPWTLRLDAPAGHELLSNGRRAEGGEQGGRVWARFEQAEPMPAYLVTLVAARLSVVETRWRDRSVRYLVPVGQEADVQRAFGRTPEMIDHFSQRLGVDYPWPRYDQVVVHDFVFGGMENVACTTMTDTLLVDERAELEYHADGLVSHELAHQWFGDLVTCQDWSQGWLNESWATYLEAVWVEHHDGPIDAAWYRWNTFQGYLAEAGRRYRRPIVAYEFREPIDLFDGHLYNKGSGVLWTLRYQLGDEAFFAGVKRYLERHAHQTVHTRHFQRALEDASGTNLDGFFAQRVHAPGHPSLDVRLGRDGDQVTVAVKQTQSGEGVPEVYTLTLRVVLVREDGGEQVVDLRIDERDRTFVLPGAAGVSHVRVDPGFRTMAEISLKGPDAWLEKLLADGCPVLALRAGRGLLADGSRRGFDAVCKAIGAHPFHGVRGSLAGELAKAGTPSALRVLVDALGRETDPRARRAVASALGRFRDPLAADALVALLDGELPTWQLHGAALVALGQTRDPRAIDALVPHLEVRSWSDHVRQKALEALAETEDERVLPRLLDHTQATVPDRTRASAAAALGRLGDAVESLRRKASERLVEMLAEPGFRAQLAAVAALGRIGDPSAEAALSRTHRTAPDGRTRRAAYEALQKIRRGRTTEAGLGAIRRRLDELAEENARLRDRVDRLQR